MGHIKIDWPSASPTLSAALLSAALACGAPALGEEYAKLISRQDARWNSPDASHASFQGVTISHGSTAATTVTLGSASIESDPWQELEALEADWDANGAEPVSRDAIAHATRFVESLPLLGATFTPFAHPNGSVGLEAEKAGKAAYLIVSPTAHFAYVLRVGETVHRGSDVDASVMRKVIDLLF